MGNKKSKELSEYPTREFLSEFYQLYKNNPQDPALKNHSLLDFFQAHYFEMVKFCRLNKLSEDQLWGLVRINGNFQKCLCPKCNFEF